GCDISNTGIRKAAQRCPDIPFYCLGDTDVITMAGQFDLIYTHHVLEHVTDLTDVLNTISKLLKPSGRVLHIAPCGNHDSFEQRITALAASAPDTSGRFVTDDSSHVRRLTSGQLTAASQPAGLTLESARFANQFWGSIEYLSNYYYGSILLDWINPARGID